MSPLRLLCVVLLCAGLGSAQDNKTNATTAPTEAPTDPPTPPPMPYGPYTVTYSVEYADEDCFMKDNLTIMEGSGSRFVFDYNVPDGITTDLTLQDDITVGVSYSVQHVMEVAVDNHSNELYFSVLYTGNETGYFVKGIGKIRSTADCMWFLYYRAPSMEYPFLKSLGVSEFVAEPNSTVVMRYQYPPIHAVYYEIDFPHRTNCTLQEVPRPDPLIISLYFGAPNYTYTVQKVMELAVDQNPSYQFLVTYYGRRRGYEIDAINGTENHDDCSWHFFYIPPRTARESAKNYSNISHFTVEANSTILMSFQIIDRPPLPTEPPTDPPTPSSSSPAPLPSSEPASPSETPTEPPTTPSPDTPSPDPPSSSMLPMPTVGGPSAAGTHFVDYFALLFALIAYLVCYV